LKKEKEIMSFLDHLEVLRWHLVRISIAVLITGIGVFLAKDFFIDTVLLGPRRPDFQTYVIFCDISLSLGLEGIFCFTEPPFELLNTKMAGQFTTHILVAFLGGIVISFPYAVFEFWRFISPGLSKTEKKSSRGVVFSASLLFFLGVAFGYYLIAPLSVQFLGSYTISDEIVNRIDLTSFIKTITSVTLSSGVLFELPVIVFFLSKAGILTPAWMKAYRRHAIVVVLILSAIITPPDILSQILVSIPVILLYELSIGISRRQESRRMKKELAL
jgi:sec-independent protein translocase protein TatC